jgi:hypothetical protein
MTLDINRDYFEWLCSLVGDSKISRHSYAKLLDYLHHTEFTFVIPMDENRCIDGANLRYRYGLEHNIDGPVIASCLDNEPCSILEMMVALAVRVEEQIMGTPGRNCPGRWFWMMIRSLGLQDMYDKNFDGEYVNFVVWRFLNLEYKRDGEGGLVHIPGILEDLRSMEIWYQMMRYLSNYRRNGE